MLTHTTSTALFGMLMLLLLCLHYFIFPLHEFIFIFPVLGYFVLVAWGSSQINSNYHLTVLCQSKDVTSKHIALSFDDGPHETVTPLVLDWLKKHEISATFFCIGKNIEGKEALLQRMHSEGHVIANHSYSHSYFFDFFGSSKIKNELSRTNELVEKLLGSKPALFRPPYGVTTPSIAQAVEQLKLTCIGWNVRSMDGVSKNQEKIIERVCAQIQPGAILLFHDTYEQVIPVLDATFQHCRANGFKIVSLEKLVKIKPYV